MKEEEILKLLNKNDEAIKQNLLKSPVIENIKIVVVDFLDRNLKKDSLLSLQFEKLKTNKNIKSLWSNQDGYPSSSPSDYLSPWVKVLKEYLDTKTVKDRWEDENYFVETRMQGKDSDVHVLVGKKGEEGKSHSTVDGKTGEIRIEDNQIDSSEILPVLETYLKFSDGRTVVSRRGKLEELESGPGETGPMVDIDGGFTVSGGSDGQTVGFQVKSIGNSPAVDIKCQFLGDGEVILQIDTISSRLSPEEKSQITNIKYSGTPLSEKQISDIKILFEFKDVKGTVFKTGRLIKQDPRADGKYNIHSRPGEFVLVK